MSRDSQTSSNSNSSGRHRSEAVFEQAAERVRVEIRRLDDLHDDVRRRIADIRWRGRSADYFRRHAAYQAVRARHNRELLESLRTVLLDASRAAGAKPGAML